MADVPPGSHLQRFWQVLHDFFTGAHEEEQKVSPEDTPSLSTTLTIADEELVTHAMSEARRPTFSGTESTPWHAPTWADCMHAFHDGGNMDTMNVGDAPATLKRKVAGISLLGDPAADTFRDLTLFPVVNVRTGKLNEHACRAVLGGRGAQASISADARSSARNMARRLLNSEFDANLPTQNQTDQDLRESLYGALAREMGVDTTPIFIDSVDVPNQTFTYRQGERLRQRRWQMTDGLLTLDPAVTDVQRDTTYHEVPDTGDLPQRSSQPMMPMAQRLHQEEDSMNDVCKRRVDALIANERTRWSDHDRHFLESCDEAFLIRLEQQPLDAPVVQAQQPATVSEAIATLPAHLQEPLQAMADEYEQRKLAAIKLLMTNKECPFTEDELQTMTAQRVEKLVAMTGQELPLRPGQQVVREVRVRDYAGRGLPHMRTMTDEDEIPAPPSTFAKIVELQRQRGQLAS